MTQAAHSFAVRLPPAPAGQRIGLLGGSFNPAHDGHRLISEIAMRRLGLNAVWWIVSPGNPLKSHAELAPQSARILDARRIAASPRIVVTGFETHLGSPYTVDTLSFLRRRRRDVHFVWLMGADNLASVHCWKDWRWIFALMPVAVVDRPGWHLKATASVAARTFAQSRVRQDNARPALGRSAPSWTLLTGPLSQHSSTALRVLRRKAAQ